MTAVHVRRLRQDPTVAPGSFTIDVNCPANAFVVGGGYDRTLDTASILRSFPYDGDTWRLYGINGSVGSVAMRAYATCLRTTPVGAISASGSY